MVDKLLEQGYEVIGIDCFTDYYPRKIKEANIANALKNLSLKKKALPKKGDMYAYKFRGKRYDAGDKFGYIKAIIDSALEGEELKEEVKEHLKERMS